MLLTPIVVECFSRASALMANAEVLHKYGLEIDMFGELACNSSSSGNSTGLNWRIIAGCC